MRLYLNMQPEEPNDWVLRTLGAPDRPIFNAPDRPQYSIVLRDSGYTLELVRSAVRKRARSNKFYVVWFERLHCPNGTIYENPIRAGHWEIYSIHGFIVHSQVDAHATAWLKRNQSKILNEIHCISGLSVRRAQHLTTDYGRVSGEFKKTIRR